MNAPDIPVGRPSPSSSGHHPGRVDPRTVGEAYLLQAFGDLEQLRDEISASAARIEAVIKNSEKRTATLVEMENRLGGRIAELTRERLASALRDLDQSARKTTDEAFKSFLDSIARTENPGEQKPVMEKAEEAQQAMPSRLLFETQASQQATQAKKRHEKSKPDREISLRTIIILAAVSLISGALGAVTVFAATKWFN